MRFSWFINCCKLFCPLSERWIKIQRVLVKRFTVPFSNQQTTPNSALWDHWNKISLWIRWSHSPKIDSSRIHSWTWPNHSREWIYSFEEWKIYEPFGFFPLQIWVSFASSSLSFHLHFFFWGGSSSHELTFQLLLLRVLISLLVS